RGGRRGEAGGVVLGGLQEPVPGPPGRGSVAGRGAVRGVGRFAEVRGGRRGPSDEVWDYRGGVQREAEGSGGRVRRVLPGARGDPERSGHGKRRPPEG